MTIKKNILKILLLALWMVLGGSVLVLLVAAVNIKNKKSCKGIDIEIEGVKEIYFLDKADVVEIVSDEGVSNPVGRAITAFNLERLEAILEKNVWVKDAELFFDNNLLLHIHIMEKEPVARIFTDRGNSYYLDSSGSRMPLNNKMNVKLPVFTGFPESKKRSASADSLLTEHIKRLTLYIINDAFWMAQIAQIEITRDGNFEMIPTVGNHVIQFGNGDNYESKFRRLFIFYKQVLSQAGFDKYSRIIVQYDKQVIGTRKKMTTKIDSIQAFKNIQKMIEESKKISEDSVYNPYANHTAPLLSRDSTIAVVKIDSGNYGKKKALKEKSNTKEPAGASSKKVSVNRPVRIIENKQTDQKPKPKAVMKKL